VLVAGCTDGEAGAPAGPQSSTTALDTGTTAAAPEVTPETSAPTQLVERLRAGGYVLYFRHAATDPEPADQDPVVLADCTTQRNLSPEGRRQADSIGQAFRDLGLPVGSVLSSPFCRALETARLAFGEVTVEPGLENHATADDETERQARVDTLRRLLSTRPAEGSNTVLVGHGFNISGAADVSIAEGEAAVFRPEGNGRFSLVATVPPTDWPGLAAGTAEAPQVELREFPVPAGSRPHDVAPAADGTVWYTAQAAGELGRLDPATGQVERILLGEGSSPHGVIVGPDGAAWVTDSGLNAIVRVDPETKAVEVFPLPGEANVNLNTAAFDGGGTLWFTGQAGYYGRVDPASGQVEIREAPSGRGPYGITATPEGHIYYASLAGNHLARIIDPVTGEATVLEPPTPGQGARRVWSDSRGRLWISEWDAGQLGMYDPATEGWREWKVPGDAHQPYAVYVDERIRFG
jgi:virginiamycin B lyase